MKRKAKKKAKRAAKSKRKKNPVARTREKRAAPPMPSCGDALISEEAAKPTPPPAHDPCSDSADSDDIL